ncbi:DoxX family protein [Flavobacterium sp. N3904]|uniref:DoxX family protein n=1 Tax=Flavobacterium sp. N3904 TaxID=2986835 RepID=UPI0022242BC9|nr:MauE/DoxX family redox-associated membrane protein [Flavobacterium sp. N3904]
MRLNIKIQNLFIECTGLIYIILFVYAAGSKILDFQNFQAQLGQSPLLSPFADLVSYIVICIELIIAVLLSIPRLRYFALWAAVALMGMFTTYIVIILHFSYFVPCSCGGILEKLGWKEHLIFNIAFLLLAIVAILMQSFSKRTLVRLSILVLGSVLVITALFLFSEDIMQKENPFIRRFPQATAAKVASIDLRNLSYYVAGTDKNKIYLANRLAPLEVLEIDSNLKNKKKYTIELDRENFNFKAVEIQVCPPYFYVTDGTVPVIYRGLISEWKASVIMVNTFYFSDIVFINPEHWAFRTQKSDTKENIIGIATSYDSLKIKYSPRVLQKQMDGIFDTDGTLQYSATLHKLIYTYYYRNQYSITDENLTVEHRANTIDTTTKAKLKIVKIKQSGDIKLAAPPYMVNRHTTVRGNLLFVNSQLRGKYEEIDVWKYAAVVDVYDLSKRIYLLSFYVYDEEAGRMKNFFAADSALYVISGHYLLKYGYGKRIQSKIKEHKQ